MKNGHVIAKKAPVNTITTAGIAEKSLNTMKGKIRKIKTP